MSEKDCNLIQSNTNQILSAKTFLGKIVLSASLKDFSMRTLQELSSIYFGHGKPVSNKQWVKP